jgi:hypothetical protein
MSAVLPTAMRPSLWVGIFVATLERLGATETPDLLRSQGERLYITQCHLGPEEAAAVALGEPSTAPDSYPD